MGEATGEKEGAEEEEGEGRRRKVQGEQLQVPLFFARQVQEKEVIGKQTVAACLPCS